MKINGFDLSYCLNIYPGESLEDTLYAIKTNCPQVKQAFDTDSFGLGLRISNLASKDLHGNTAKLKSWLDDNGFYAFTVNAFPFGNFHEKPVKEKVYYPDWGTQERLQYTNRVADILAELLPENTIGSISTVPVTYGKEEPAGTLEVLSSCSHHLKNLEERTGKKVVLALEPEPDCFLERTDETIEFMQRLYAHDSINKEYIGVCFDTCHIALQFENPLESLQKLVDAGITIPKIQVSSVLEFKNEASADVLMKFDDGVYLHQTLIDGEEGITQFKDLPEAVSNNLKGTWRVHCHVPLHFEENSGIGSTSYLLTKEFFDLAKGVCPHLETETYTYSVLPDTTETVNESIVKEINFVLNRIDS